VILSLDVDNEKVSLGIKQLSEDVWPRITKEYTLGSRHPGKVVWVGERALVVETEPLIEGSIASGDLPQDLTSYQVDQSVDVVVHSLDDKERKLTFGLVSEGAKK